MLKSLFPSKILPIFGDFYIYLNDFFDQPVKNKQEAYEKLIKRSRNGDYTTGNLLHFPYHQNYYKHIGIDLLRQINTSIPQLINFVGTLEEDDDTTMSFIAESSIKQF